MKMIVIGVAVAALGISAYITNAVKFFNCDFNTPLKCEIVHGIGVFVPPVSVVTVWFSPGQ